MILGLETSCDETAAALITSDGDILANIVSSQAELHARFGGVVPEVASRRHLELVMPVVQEALGEADASLGDVERVAVTQGPGLVGALLVGLSAAKALAWSRRLPLVPVDHLHGHVASLYLEPDAVEPPFLCLLASGGHTMLLDVRDRAGFAVLGETLDDAAGEAFDKVARFIGLGFPGGPAIDRLAKDGNPNAYDFPRPLLREDNYDFSLSGLKTAVIRWVRERVARGEEFDPADLAASFQEAIVDVQVAKTMRAAEDRKVGTVVLAGGVAANSRLRERMAEEGKARGIEVVAPSPALCTDNGAMIAAAGIRRLERGERTPLDAAPVPGLSLG